MMKKIISIISLLTIVSFFAVPFFVGAQEGPLEICKIRTEFKWQNITYKSDGASTWPADDKPLTTTTYKEGKGMSCILDLIQVVVNWTTAVMAFIIVLFVVLAAFDFLTSGGDAKKLESARHKILYAAVALVVMLLSRMVVPIIKAIVGA